MTHALVIGVGPGLGRHLALVHAQHGNRVTLMARSAESLEAVAAEVRGLGGAAATIPVDVSDLDELDAAVAAAGADEPIAVLHYNASMHTGGLLDADPKVLRAAIDVNAHGAVVAVQAALPDLRRTGGRVLITGGGIALKPRGEYGVLALGKSAIRGATFALAQELEPLGITTKMLTVNGFIRPDSAFSPERIAAAFWDFGMGDSPEVELVYTGR